MVGNMLQIMFVSCDNVGLVMHSPSPQAVSGRRNILLAHAH